MKARVPSAAGTFGAWLSMGEVSDEVLAAKLEMVYEHLPLALGINLAVAIAIAGTLMEPGRREAEFLWVLGNALVNGLRFLGWRQREARRGGDGQLYRWRRHLLLGSAGQGLMWALAGTLLFPALPVEQLFLLLVLSGLSGGAVIFLAPIWLSYVLYMGMAVVPTSLHLLLVTQATHRSVGAMGLAFAVVMVFASRKTCLWLEESLAFGHEKEGLSRHLQAANADLEVYRNHLEATVAQRTTELSLANDRLQVEFHAKELERQRAASAEARYRSLFDAMGEGFGHVDANEVFLFANPAAETIFGVAPGALAGQSLLRFLDPEQAAFMQEQTAIRIQGQPSTYIQEIIRPDGGRRSIQIKASPVRDAEGAYAGASGVFRDVTEQLATERALRLSEERNVAILEAMPDMLFLNSRDGRYLDCHVHNPAAMDIAPAQLLQGSVRELLPGPLAQRFMEAFAAAIDTRAVQQFHYESTGLDGVPRHHEARVVRCNDDSAVTVVRNITEQRMNEEAMRQTQKLESLGVLAGGIAHDFNNLLGAILGNLSLLQGENPEGSRGRRYLDRMELAVKRASELTHQMLAYSGRGRFLVRDLDLNSTLQELTSLLQVCISKRAVLRFDLAPGLPLVAADHAQLQQVVMTLVSNASEALEGQDGEIQVATRFQELDAAAVARASLVLPLAPGPHVVLQVRDGGTGMTPEVLSRIFDPFFTTKESGRGLGLSAMLGILRGHGAGIEIESQPGQGSTFRLFLPASTRPPALPAPREEPGGRGRILLVDDDPVLLETAQAMLEDLGYPVFTAQDGVAALDCWKAHPGEVALVLLDLTMPRMDGHQTFLALRGLSPKVPVIISSGYDATQSLQSLQGPGMPSFLHKPYSIRELRQAVEASLGA